jgi:hypothetical protein
MNAAHPIVCAMDQYPQTSCGRRREHFFEDEERGLAEYF